MFNHNNQQDSSRSSMQVKPRGNSYLNHFRHVDVLLHKQLEAVGEDNIHLVVVEVLVGSHNHIELALVAEDNHD
jgi:hypothetical protein